MSNFQIEVLAVTGPTKVTKNGKSWSALEIAYKKDGKVEGKKLVDFNDPDVFNAVAKAKQGEVYNVTSEKKGEYWYWTDFSKGEKQDASENTENGVPSSDTSKQEASTGNRKSTGRVTGSNYETPEERARRQRLIVRQSSLAQALELTKHNFPKGVDVEEVLDLAEKFVEFAYKNTKEAAVQDLKDLHDDIPF